MSLTPKQLAIRKNFMTATDIRDLVLGTYGGAYAVWLRKQADATEIEVSDAMDEGSRAEDFLAGFIPIRPGETVDRQVWITRGRIGATVDATISTPERLWAVPVETKRHVRDLEKARQFGADGSAEVPDEEYIQSQIQSYVCDADYGLVIADLAGRGVATFEIPHNRDLTATLAARADAWFETHVLGDVRPELEDEAAYALATLVNRRTIAPTKSITVAARQGKHLIQLLDDARRTESLGKRMGEIAKTRLAILAGDATEIVAGNRRAVWKVRETKRLDVQRLREEYPEIYVKCQRIDVERVLKTGDGEDGE